MLVTLLGIVMVARLVQLINTESLMLVTPVPMVTEVRLVQLLNASLSIYDALLGMVMVVSWEQFLKVLKPIYPALEVGVKVTVVMLLQPSSALFERIVTLGGMVKLVRPVQFRNA